MIPMVHVSLDDCRRQNFGFAPRNSISISNKIGGEEGMDGSPEFLVLNAISKRGTPTANYSE